MGLQWKKGMLDKQKQRQALYDSREVPQLTTLKNLKETVTANEVPRDTMRAVVWRAWHSKVLQLGIADHGQKPQHFLHSPLA